MVYTEIGSRAKQISQIILEFVFVYIMTYNFNLMNKVYRKLHK